MKTWIGWNARTYKLDNECTYKLDNECEDKLKKKNIGWIGTLVGLGYCLDWSIGWLGVLVGLGHCLDWSIGWLGVLVALGRCLDWMLLWLLASLWALDGLGSCVFCWICVWWCVHILYGGLYD